MKSCACGAAYPNFMAQCLSCRADLGIPPSVSASSALERVEMGYPRQSREELDCRKAAILQKLRADARRECELFYARYAGGVSDRYGPGKLTEYLTRYMHDGLAVEQVEQGGRDLVALLHSVAGLGREHEEAKARRRLAEAEAEQARQRELERRRLAETEEEFRRARAALSADQILRQMRELRRMGLTEEEIAAELAAFVQNALSGTDAGPPTGRSDLYG